MMARKLAVFLWAGAGALLACGGDEPLPSPGPGTTSSSGGLGGDGGGSGGGGQGGGGSAQGGGGSAPECGNDVAETDELCDGADFGGKTCSSFGFDAGSLACSPDCTIDTSSCSGVEQCQDAKDNDGDTFNDCADTDCALACADACAVTPILNDPSVVLGDTTGHAPFIESSLCSDPSGGPAVVYEFTAGVTGFLDVELLRNTNADLGIAVRTTCAAAATELACANDHAGAGRFENITIPITMNDTVFVAVSGIEETQAGTFSLAVRSRQTACGDGVQDPSEECDDLNTIPGDGCDAACALEPTEVEPNNTGADATPHTVPFFAAIAPAGDEDLVSVSVENGPSSLVVEIADVTSSACLSGELDSYLEVLDSDGVTVLVGDDDSGTGACSRVIATGLSAGLTYYVRVKAYPSGGTPTFPYRLDVTIIQDICGDTAVTPGEQCDDGNVTPDDGCSPTCQFELAETEPNGSAVQADTYAAPWLATVAPAADIDFVAVTVPGPSSTITASTGDHGTGTCATNKLDSYLEIRGTDGVVVLQADNDSGPGYCSFVTAANLPAGTYFVVVKAGPLVPNGTFFYALAITAP